MSDDIAMNNMADHADGSAQEVITGNEAVNVSEGDKYAEMIVQLEKDGLYDVANRLQAQQSSRGLEVPYDKSVLDPFPTRKQLVADYKEQEASFSSVTENLGQNLEFFDATCVDIDKSRVSSTLRYTKQYHHINGGRGEVDHAVFSQDGQFFAIVHANKKDGAPEYFLTFNSVSKVYTSHGGGHHNRSAAKPNVRTSSDHNRSPVTHVEFHPSEPFLLSSSSQSIKFHDHSRNATSTAYRTFVDHGLISSFTVHPAGAHLVVCSDNAQLKLVEQDTFETFVNLSPNVSACPSIQGWMMNDGKPAKASCADFLSAESTHQDVGNQPLPGLSFLPRNLHQQPIYNLEETGLHQNIINHLAYTPTGGMLASASLDGSMKLWDTRSMNLIKTYNNHHQGQSMSSLKMAPSGHYVLTYGSDGIVNVTDVRMHRIALQCKGLVNFENRGQVELTSDGKYIVATDEVTKGVVFFHSETGTLAHNMKDLHRETITSLCFNPLHDSFITTSSDNSYIYFSGNDHFDVMK